MKKFLSLVFVALLVLSLVACGGEAVETDAPETNAPAVDETEAPAATVMTHADYIAAEMDAAVVVETYVQATQSWWDNKITIYAQSADGAYFIYEAACTEEDAAKLVPGTKIRVSGVKGAWAGEVEIMDSTLEILEGDTYIAEAADLTSVLANADELIKHQNELAIFKGLTIEAIEYKNGEPGDDIYVTVGLDGASYSFCIERYLTAPDTDVYKAFTEETVKVGDKVDVTGFVYWYEGVNTHITAIAIAE